MNHHPGLTFVKDDQGRYFYVSDNFLKFFHRTRQEILSKTDFEWLSYSIAYQFGDNDRLVRMTGRPLEVTESVPQSQGVVHSLVNKFPISHSSGRILLGGTAIYITQRLAAEAELNTPLDAGQPEDRLILRCAPGEHGATRKQRTARQGLPGAVR